MSDALNDEALLYGVPAIAGYLKMDPRKVYHLKDKHGLPTFKIGETVCARPSAIRAWLSEQERATGRAR